MRYRDFIAQLEELVTGGEHLRDSSTGHTDPAFRHWRHTVQSLVDEAFALGYRLPGPFTSRGRAYIPLYSTANPDEIIGAFRQDMSDSLIELRHYLDQYRRYGEPRSVQPALEDKVEPVAPEKVTLHWLFKNVPISLWVAAIGVLSAVFVFGAAVGNTEPIKDVLAWFKSQ